MEQTKRVGILSKKIDETAEEYAYNNWEDNDYHTGASEGLPFDAIGHTEKYFKAGAEWMARQMKQEQSEMDFEKEFQEYWYLHQYDHRLRRQVLDGHGKAVLENIARHFYKLRLNTRKEE